MPQVRTVSMSLPDDGGEDAARRQYRQRMMMADALMERGGQQERVYSHGYGLAKVGVSIAGALFAKDAEEKEQAEEKKTGEQLAEELERHGNSMGWGGSPSPASTATAAPSPSQGEGSTYPYPATSGPRPQPSSGPFIAETEADVQRLERAMGQRVDPADLDRTVRTVYGEAGGEAPIGQQAVAGVIANRARQSGMTPSDVATAPGQFEPWSDPTARARMEGLSPSSPTYQKLAELVAPALRGEADPSGGASHFYAPKAQAALGRPAPAWDDGTGRDIGGHRFFAQGYGPGAGSGQPQAAASPAAGQPFMTPELRAMIVNPRTRAAAVSLINSRIGEAAERRREERETAATREKRTWETTRPDVQVFRDEKTGEIVGLDKNNLRAGPNVLREGQKPGPKPDEVSALRKEYNALPSVKNFNTVAPVYGSILKSYNNPSRAGDLDFVYALGKIFDPDSVVREGEMMMVNNAQALPDRVLGAINHVIGGQRLQQNIRRELLEVAKTRVGELRVAAERDKDRYGGIVERSGMSRADVLSDLPTMPDLPAPEAASAPAGAATAAPPPTAIEALRQSRDRKADFDAKYGPGAADRALGVR